MNARAVFLLVSGVSLFSSAAVAGEFSSRTSRSSANAPRVMLAPRKTTTATIRIQFRAGAYDDGYRRGLTRLSQQALLGANEVDDYQRFLLDLYAANAELELETGVRECAFELTAPKQDFNGLALRLVRLVLTPRVSRRGFEAARSRALQDQGNAGLNDLTSMFARTVFSESEYGNSPYGDRDSIRSLTVEDVQRHILTRLSPANATVIVAGAFDVRRVKAALSRARRGRARPLEKPKGEHSGTYHLKSWVEFHLVGYPLALKAPESVAAAHLAAAIVQERTFDVFRKMGIAYSVEARPIHREWMDFLLVVLPIHSETQAPVASRLQAQLDEIREGRFLDGELERNRAYLLRTFANIDRDSKLLARELGMGNGDVEWFGPRVVRAISEMTSDQFVEHMKPRLADEMSIHVELSPRTVQSSTRNAGASQ